MAAQYGHRECVVALKLAGCDLNQQTLDGFTAMYLAAQNGHRKVRGILAHAFRP
jgi:ankyrin repeat protein